MNDAKPLFKITNSHLLAFGLFLFSTLLHAQGVMNPDFNKKKGGKPLHWYAIENYQPHKSIHGRKNVAGLVTYSKTGYRQFLAGAFTLPLQKGRKYRFRCLVSNTLVVDYSKLGVLFLQDAIRFKSVKALGLYLDHNKQNYFTFKTVKTAPAAQWSIVEIEFTANEDHTHFVVGYYGDDDLNNSKFSDYMYFDKLSLEAND